MLAEPYGVLELGLTYRGDQRGPCRLVLDSLLQDNSLEGMSACVVSMLGVNRQTPKALRP
jgi:hypothetical protein